jgi:hypothetical protein
MHSLVGLRVDLEADTLLDQEKGNTSLSKKLANPVVGKRRVVEQHDQGWWRSECLLDGMLQQGTPRHPACESCESSLSPWLYAARPSNPRESQDLNRGITGEDLRGRDAAEFA